MLRQDLLTDDMRVELIDWLFHMQTVLKLNTETIHVAANIIDRYLSVRPMIPTGMKLLGIGALRVSSHLNESKIVELSHVIQFVDKQKIS
jgi:hypothetical protein